MINRPEKAASPRVSETRAPERVFDAALNKAKTLAATGASNQQLKPDDYKEVTALPAKLDIDTLKVVSEDKDAGVIYFEQDGNKFKITREGADKVQEGFDLLKGLHFGHAVAPVNQGGPDEGTPLYDLLHTLAETQGTPAGKAIREALGNLSQLKVVSEDPKSGVILFEHQGKKYMISQSEAALPQPGADLSNPNPNAGSSLYTFLQAVHKSEGTPAFDYRMLTWHPPKTS